MSTVEKLQRWQQENPAYRTAFLIFDSIDGKVECAMQEGNNTLICREWVGSGMSVDEAINNAIDDYQDMED